MNIEERIAHHRRMAEAYRDAYLRQEVQVNDEYNAFPDVAIGVHSHFHEYVEALERCLAKAGVSV